MFLEFFLRGVAVGVVAGVPLGPASVAVVHLSLRQSRFRALALGAGAAFVDFAYCLAATTGVAAVVHAWPFAQDVLRTGGGVLLVLLGVVMALKARAQPDTEPESLPGGGKRSFLAGVLISAFNPALISSWILFSSTAFTGADLAGAFAAATGVFLGTFGWFAGLAWGADRFRRHPFLRSPWVPRVLGSALAIYGAVLVVPPLVDAMFRA